MADIVTQAKRGPAPISPRLAKANLGRNTTTKDNGGDARLGRQVPAGLRA